MTIDVKHLVNLLLLIFNPNSYDINNMKFDFVLKTYQIFDPP